MISLNPDLPQVAGPSVGSCNKLRLQSREVLAPEEQQKKKNIVQLTSSFFSYYLRIQGPKYVTIGFDQSSLISAGVLVLTLIGYESSPSQIEYMDLWHSLFLFTFCLFFLFVSYIIHSLWWQKDSLYPRHKENKERNRAYVLSLLWKLRHIGHNAFHFHYITGF